MAVILPIITEFDGAGISKAVRQFKQLETTSQKAQFAISKAAVPAAAALAGIAVLAKNAVAAASDLGEAQNKANVIFKDAAKDITKFADTASTKLGQSKTDAINAATTFGAFGKSAGLSGEDLGKFAIQFTTLASDLASFNNTSPEEAVLAIGAAMRGESEPIRKYNVLLNDAAIKAEAMSLGIIKTTKEALTPQQKVLAVQSAILKQTSDQQGDFARTSDGLANSQRILKAELEDVSAQFGNALLPAIEGVLPHLKTFAKIAKDNPEDVKNLAIGITAMASATLLLNFAMKTNPFVAMAGGIVAANIAMEKLLDFTNKIGGVFGFLGKIAGGLALPGFAAKAVGDLFKTSADKSVDASIKIGDSMTRSKAAIEGLEIPLVNVAKVTDTNTVATDKNTDAEKRRTAAINAQKTAVSNYLSAYSGYAKSIAGTVTGMVSLADAQASALDINEKAGGDKATLLGQFQKQINDAKQFASNLKTLIGQGLGQAGLAQLMNLGPVAGLAVTDQMILGSGTLTVGNLNADLAGLEQSAAGLGGAAANAFMGNRSGVTNNITVNAGLVSSPAQVGQDIIDAILKAQRSNGQVFAAA